MADLFGAQDKGGARNTDPKTSHAAAESINVTKLETKVLGMLKSFGPMTAEQVAVNLSLQLPTITPRFAPLLEKNMIRKKTGTSGETLTRKSVMTGRRRIIYEHQPDESLWIERPRKKTAKQEIELMKTALRLIREIVTTDDYANKSEAIYNITSDILEN